MNPTPTDDWDAHWRDYAGAASVNPAQLYRHRLIRRLAGAAWADRAVPARFLDIGSGQGDLAIELHRKFPAWEFAGFEMSAQGVAVSRAKLPGTKFIEANVFQPPAELAEFAGWADLAACSEVLEHVDDPAAFLRAARTYLRPDARLFITVPGGPMSAFDRHIGHRCHFTADSLRAVIAAAGLVVERVERSGFPFFNLYRLLVILSGRRLARAAQRGAMSRGVGPWALARVFSPLLDRSLRDSPGGWQMVAEARDRK